MVCVGVRVYGYRVWGTCNNRTMVPHKEIQWNNGTPQGKFYSLATFGHKREDNQVPPQVPCGVPSWKKAPAKRVHMIMRSDCGVTLVCVCEFV